jgi:hypothetical protein
VKGRLKSRGGETSAQQLSVASEIGTLRDSDLSLSHRKRDTTQSVRLLVTCQVRHVILKLSSLASTTHSMVLLSWGAALLPWRAHGPKQLEEGRPSYGDRRVLLRICSTEDICRAVIKMPVPVSSMPQGARAPSTLDKRMNVLFVFSGRQANNAQSRWVA